MSRKINKRVFVFQQLTCRLIPLFHGCFTLFVPNLFPVCSQFFGVNPSDETVCDGYTGKSCPFSVSRFKVCVDTNFSSGTCLQRISSTGGNGVVLKVGVGNNWNQFTVPRNVLPWKRCISGLRGRRGARIPE
jgi:hypothetical protein